MDMLGEKEQLEQEILSLISKTGQPVGCGAISAVLNSRGISISEATVGRVLRDFDHSGYTEKAGYQGRILSARGSDRLTELANREKSLQWGAEFASALQGHTKEQLLEVLIARRAIEGELAALAALNGNGAEKEQLQSTLEKQRSIMENGGGAAQADVNFHAAIAQMAGNKILAMSIELIRQDTQLSPVLEYIRKHVHSLVYIDHQNIFQAIHSGMPDAAKEAMVAHINNLIQDVETYWERRNNK